MHLGTDSEEAIFDFVSWLNEQRETESNLWNNMCLQELAVYYIEHQHEID